MRVLITLDYPPERGGIQRYLEGVVGNTYGPGDLVVVGCRHGEVRMPAQAGAGPEIIRRSWPASRLNKKWALAAMVIPYLRVCRQHRGKMTVECGNVYAAVLPWFLYPLTRQRYRVYTYGTELIALRGKCRGAGVLRRVLGGAERISALGRFTADLVAQAGIRRPVDIMPPRLPIARVPQPLAARECGTVVVRLLSVGRLVEHKGHACLLQAVGQLPETGRWHCTIVGDGPTFKDLVALRSHLGLEERVTFRGEVSDEQLAEELRRADVFVHPSLQTAAGVEGFGIVLLEAMAYNVPIVASRSGGIPEVLGEGSCGVLVEPGDPGALAMALQRICSSPAQAAEMAGKARQRLLEYYVWR